MNIKKKIRSIALAAFSAVIATTAAAQQVTVSWIPGYHGNAGELNVSPIIGAGYGSLAVVSNGFETFCTSRNGDIAPGNAYYYTVDTNGIFQPDNLPLTKGAAWLYSQFAAGILGGYDYLTIPGDDYSGRTGSAINLQLAIWTLGGQYSYNTGGQVVDVRTDASLMEAAIGSNPFLKEVADFFGGGTNGLLIALADNIPGGYNVGVLNLNFINPDGSVGGVAQPLLVLLPCTDPDATITAPVSVSPGTTNTASVPDAGVGASYAWTINNGTIISGQGMPSITWVAGTSGATVLGVTITTANGCDAVGTYTVNVVCTDPDATITAPVSVDSGSTNTASAPNAGPGATYVWTISNGTITSGQGTTSITWIAGTNGTTFIGVTITKADGCDAVGLKMVSINCEAPDARIYAPICVTVGVTNSASVADAGPGATYVWTINNGTIISGQGTRSIKWKATTGGYATLNVTVTTAGGCSAIGCKKVSVVCKEPDAHITSPTTVDRGSTNNMASVPDAGPGATYVWSITGGTITSGQGTHTIKWKAGTGSCATISVKVTVPGGCYDTGCKTITLVCGADATITAPSYVKACTTNNVASVPSAGPGATYVWTISNGTITSGQGTPTIKWTAGITGKVTLSVKVTTAGGCDETGYKAVYITSNYNWSNCDNKYVSQCLSQWASYYSSWGSWGDRWW